MFDPRLTFWLAMLMLWGAARITSAQFAEDFESDRPSWHRQESDCVIPSVSWTQQRTAEPSSSNHFEKISFETSTGSRVYVSHDVPPAYLIPELTPSVRLKSSRPGVQMLVRVVLPHTPSPTGEGPLTTLLPGPFLHSTNQWETVSFKTEFQHLKEKLQEEIWLLRRKYGAHVSDREAYIDKVVLNLYGGIGPTTVQIDDLQLEGLVSAEKIARQVKLTGQPLPQAPPDEVVQTSFATQSSDQPLAPNQKQPSLVTRDGTVLLVEKKPFLARVIQHHGEPFDFLRALGFNVIELPATATYEQLEQARSLELWIVCPPPSSVGMTEIEFQYDRVLAWSVGVELTGRNLSTTQQRVREIHDSDRREGRPIVGHAQSHWSKFSELLDIVNVGVEPIGTSFLASRYSDWIQQRTASFAHHRTIWADIQTDFPVALANQISAVARVVPPVPIEPQQIKFLTYEAIASGARGLRFKSRSRLDASDPATRLRALTLQWLNSEIDRLEPWVAAGALMGEILTDDPQLEITALSTNRSRLLLVQRPTHHEQYVAGDVPLRTITFHDADATFTDRAMLITDHGLEALPNQRSLGSNHIQIDNCPMLAAVVLTQDPNITNMLNQSYPRVGRTSTTQMHTDLTRQWLAIMQLIERQLSRMNHSTSTTSGAMNEAVNSFRNASSLMESNSAAVAWPYLNQADERLAFARREMITEPLSLFQSKTSSPLLAHTSLVPMHWELADRMTAEQWQPNGLAGGDFENLDHMMRSGWENHRLDDEQISTTVSLNDEAAKAGQYGLRLQVSTASPSVVIDATPLWITTPPIPVRGGQLVRIHGWVRVPQTVGGNLDGLMITDSLGDQAMAERIPLTEGWQEFTLYRGVTNDHNLRVTFALTGTGVAMLDEVTVRAVDLK